MMDILKSTLEDSPVVRKGDYDYFVHPITDGVPEVSPDLLHEVVGEIRNQLSRDYDKIVAIEAMGLPVGAVLAVEVNKPLVIVRKKSYGLAKEVSVQQITGYSKSQLFINGLEAHDKVVIVDDVLSTGGTLKAVITALTDMGVDIVDVIVVIEKGENRERIEMATGIEIKTLVKVDVVDGKVIVTEI